MTIWAFQLQQRFLREDRAIERRVRAAGFRDLKTIEDFDFSFNPSLNRRQIMDLATCRFIREQNDILFTGPPGVGKSHLAQALGHQAAKMGYVVMYRSIFDTVGELIQAETLNESDKAMRRYLRPDLLIIDDMGLKKLPKQSGEYLFEIIMRRYELRSTIMTSNRPLDGLDVNRDFKAIYVDRASEGPVMLEDGRAEALWGGGVGWPGFLEVAKTKRGARFIAPNANEIDQIVLRRRFLRRLTIPAGSYPGQNEDIHSVGSWSFV